MNQKLSNAFNQRWKSPIQQSSKPFQNQFLFPENLSFSCYITNYVESKITVLGSP